MGLARLDRVSCGGSGLGAAVPRFGSVVQGLGPLPMVLLALNRLCAAIFAADLRGRAEGHLKLQDGLLRLLLAFCYRSIDLGVPESKCLLS